MPSLKDLRNRITSVRSTRKITSAMKMVAGSKLKRAETSAHEGRPYAQRMERMLSDLIGTLPTLDVAPKLLAGSGKDSSHLLIIITADRGLCGGFNVNIARAARRRIEALHAQGKQVKILCIGKKGRDSLRRYHGEDIIETLENITRTGAKFGPARDISRQVRNMFDNGEFDVCTVIFNTFKSAMSQEVTVKQIIPFPVPDVAEKASAPGVAGGHGGEDAPLAGTYEMEPSEGHLLAALLPANLSVQIFGALLESYASEQGARMTAMDNATRNAGDLIDRLKLNYNRTRQAAITSELIEIISGAEAV